MSLEKPVCFRCRDEWLYGIVHLPLTPRQRGVLVVVGGPQYRVGSHRQFVLLARYLAREGIPVFRFDYRGIGDSDGKLRTFEDIDSDIVAAMDEFSLHAGGLKEVVIWGLCDAASAALFYAHKDPRVTGLVLLNPWVRTETGIAKAYLKSYYFSRFFDPNLWRKIGQGEFRPLAAARSLLGTIAASIGIGKMDLPTAPAPEETHTQSKDTTLPERMLDGLNRYRGRVLLILSGDDLTAQEFNDTVSGSRAWRKRLGADRVIRRELSEANHTFSRREWRDQVAAWTAEWFDAS